MNGETNQPSQPQAVKFDKSFTQEVEKYIEIYKKQQKKPSVYGLAQRLGVTEETIWGWANKQKKDSEGNILDELARPNFHAAVTKLKEIEDAPQEKKLNQQQELFCKLYASDREFFANGVQSYIEAYGIDKNRPGAYNSARSSAYDLLINPHILKRIDELLEVSALNNVAVDKELAFVIVQKGDLSSKVAAIREFNRLQNRITEKIDHTTKGKELPTPIYGARATE